MTAAEYEFHNWRTDALCVEVDREMFFPKLGESVKAAIDTCTRCPVTQQCLDHALTRRERFGIWGGKTARQRMRLERERRRNR